MRKDGFVLPLVLILAVSVGLIVGGVVSLTSEMSSQYNVYRLYTSLKTAELNALHYGVWLLNRYGLSKFDTASDEEREMFVSETGADLSGKELYVFDIKTASNLDVEKDENFKIVEGKYPKIYVVAKGGIPEEIYSVVEGFDHVSADINQNMDDEGMLSRMAYVSGNTGVATTTFGDWEIVNSLDGKFGVSDHESGDFASYLNIIKSDTIRNILSLLDIELEDPNKTGEDINNGNGLFQEVDANDVRIWKRECLNWEKKCVVSIFGNCIIWEDVCTEWGYVVDLEASPVLNFGEIVHNGNKQWKYRDYLENFSASGTLLSDEPFEDMNLISEPDFVSKLATGDTEDIQMLALQIDLENFPPSLGWTTVPVATVVETGFFNYGSEEVLQKALEDMQNNRNGFVIGNDATNVVYRSFVIYNGDDENEYKIVEFDLLSDQFHPASRVYTLQTATYTENNTTLLSATLTSNDPTPSVKTITNKPYLMLLFKGETVVGDIDGFEVSVPMVIVSSETAYIPNDIIYTGYEMNDEDQLKGLNIHQDDPLFVLVSGKSIIALKKTFSFEDLNLMGSYYSMNGAFYWDHLWTLSGLSMVVKNIVDAIEGFISVDIPDPIEFTQFTEDINLFGQLVEEKSLDNVDATAVVNINVDKNLLTRLISFVTGVDEEDIVNELEETLENIFGKLSEYVMNEFIATRFERNIRYDGRIEDFVKDKLTYIPVITLPKPSNLIPGTYYALSNIKW